jgi:hypothetical protein
VDEEFVMPRFDSPLDRVKVASPCPADWDGMVGNEKVRFCGQCRLNVYNLSGMSRLEAERLLAQTEGRLCVRYFRREDGTILTEDCPVGLRALRQKVSRVATAAISAALGFFAGVGATWATSTALSPSVTMGDVAAPVPYTPTAPPAPDPPLTPIQGAIAVRPEPTMGKVTVEQGEPVVPPDVAHPKTSGWRTGQAPVRK